MLPKPDWYDQDSSKWPPDAKTFFSILLDWAERDLAAEAQTNQTQTPAPAA